MGKRKQARRQQSKVKRGVAGHKPKSKGKAKAKFDSKKLPTLKKHVDAPDLRGVRGRLDYQLERKERKRNPGTGRNAPSAEERKRAEAMRRQEMMVKAPLRATEIKMNNTDDTKDGFFTSEVEMKEQGAIKKHWYYKELNKVVAAADVILEVLDARDPMGCRCTDIENMILQHQNPDGTRAKRIILILNKIDLVPSEVVGKWIRYLRRFFPTLAFKASTQNQRSGLRQFQGKIDDITDEQLALKSCMGAQQLLGLLKNYSRTSAGSKKTINVGIIGYPNVGKSSIINSLKRSRAVAVGATPGLTKVIQSVRLDKTITLVDSPGVMFGSDADQTLVLRNCLRVEQMENPEAAVSSILERVHPEKMCQLYGIASFSSTDEFLVLLANKLGKIGRGGIANLPAAARAVLNDWNSAKIPFYTLPPIVQDVTQSELVTSWAREFDINSFQARGASSMGTDGGMDGGMGGMDEGKDEKQTSQYVVLEKKEDSDMDDSEVDDDMNGELMEDEKSVMGDEVDDGTTQGIRRLVPEGPQLNRTLRLSQKKSKKQKRRAARLAQAQQEMMVGDDDSSGEDEQMWGGSAGLGVQQSVGFAFGNFGQPQQPTSQGSNALDDDFDGWS